MNETIIISNENYRSLLDQLAAGDLTERDRRSLIEWLEGHPERWRDCGIAFLEAQLWNNAFDGWATPASQKARVSRHRSPDEANRGVVPNPRWLALSLVLTLLVAFGVGYLAGQHGSLRHASSGIEVADIHAERRQAPAAGYTSVPHNSTVIEKEDPDATTELTALTLATGPHPSDPTIQVPVLPASDLNEEILARISPALSEYTQDQLKRRGVEVTQARRFVSVSLGDGRRVVIPMQQVQMNVVRRHVF